MGRLNENGGRKLESYRKERVVIVRSRPLEEQLAEDEATRAKREYWEGLDATR